MEGTRKVRGGLLKVMEVSNGGEVRWWELGEVGRDGNGGQGRRRLALVGGGGSWSDEKE